MFLRKKEKKNVISSFDKIKAIRLNDDNAFNEMLKLADNIVDNYPLLINFSQLLDETMANYILAFLSGVAYAAGGNVYQISEEVHLFVSGDALSDGSIKNYINEVDENL